jgi:predicted regulator of Ras-like GTPase activity (Roadblock/LC7/MglB family)
MTITGREVRQILLLSLLILIAPMVLFPEQLGLGLAKVSLLYAVAELFYYAVVVFFLHRQASLFQVVQTAGVCLIYRLLLGAAFGLLIAALYSMNLSIALTLGMSRYMPALLLHIAATPFVLKPAIEAFSDVEEVPPGRVHEPVPSERPAPETKVSPQRPVSSPPHELSLRHETLPTAAVRHDAPTSTGITDANGFDRATRFIGEDSSVLLAMVIDHEGLLLGQFKRDSIEAEDVAPLALVFSEANEQVLKRTGWGSAERIDVFLSDRRIIVAREKSFNLMVVAHRQVEDLLTIRINRGLELIKKYMAERYNQKRHTNAERTYV